MSVDINVNLNQAQIMGAIRGRRSYALKYLSPEAIDLGDIELMLEAANWAPSHGQTEPWRFTVFAGDGRQQLATHSARPTASTLPKPTTSRPGTGSARPRLAGSGLDQHRHGAGDERAWRASSCPNGRR